MVIGLSCPTPSHLSSNPPRCHLHPGTPTPRAFIYRRLFAVYEAARRAAPGDSLHELTTLHRYAPGDASRRCRFGGSIATPPGICTTRRGARGPGAAGKEKSSRCDTAQRLLGFPLSKRGCRPSNELVSSTAVSANISLELRQQLSPCLHCTKWTRICQPTRCGTMVLCRRRRNRDTENTSPVYRTATTLSQLAAEPHRVAPEHRERGTQPGAATAAAAGGGAKP